MSNNFWKTKVRISCEEKLGKCQHNKGDTYIFEQPMAYIPDLCMGIQDSARPYVAQCAAGIPSWEGDNKEIYRIHCISKKGTVWRLERINE
jgi:uncharacterized repeat protein (TIGR04076 family)